MEKNDFVFYKDEKNNIFSGGYKIKNMFKELDLPAFQQKGGSSLVIPLGLFYEKKKSEEIDNKYYQEGGGVEVDDGLFNKLLELSLKGEIKEKIHKKTRKKRNINSNRSTRKKRNI
tara:strand:+ start:139 stop:486 length:348 start_codon:yes stop_codon:yes gene_type:complete